MAAPGDYSTFFNTGSRFRVHYAGDIGYAENKGKYSWFDDTTFAVGVSVSPFPIGQWVHLAATHDGSTLKNYMNGILQASTSWAGYLVDGGNSLGNGSVIQLGSTPRDGNEALTGVIDEFRISLGVIYTQNFAPPAHLTATPETRVLFRFDQGTGLSVLSDIVGGPQATLTGNGSAPGYTPVNR